MPCSAAWRFSMFLAAAGPGPPLPPSPQVLPPLLQELRNEELQPLVLPIVLKLVECQAGSSQSAYYILFSLNTRYSAALLAGGRCRPQRPRGSTLSPPHKYSLGFLAASAPHALLLSAAEAALPPACPARLGRARELQLLPLALCWFWGLALQRRPYFPENFLELWREETPTWSPPPAPAALPSAVPRRVCRHHAARAAPAAGLRKGRAPAAADPAGGTAGARGPQAPGRIPGARTAGPRGGAG